MVDVELLDEIKRGFGLKNDAEIAGFLNITRTTIHNVRYKGKRLGFRPRLKVLDHIAFMKTRDSIETWAEKLTNHNLAIKIRSLSFKLAQNQALSNIPIDADSVAEKDLIEEIKIFLNCKNDEELASTLGLARNTISAVRNGDTSLGPEPRLKILNLIEPFDMKKLESTLFSTNLLIEEIRKWSGR